jgi:hypothetical protein
MITREFLNLYGIIGLVVMAILFVLVVAKIVPDAWHIPLFIFAFAIWASRLVLRFLLFRRERSAAPPPPESNL